MSRFTRTTLKFVAVTLRSSTFAVRMSMTPMLKGPALPVTRPPTSIGTCLPSSRPMRRLKNITGTSAGIGLPKLLPPPPGGRFETPPKAKMPCPSRKKSRFSGNSTLKRVRLACCSSSSTCAKSVL